MNTFSEELRKERVAKDISLADISRKTHINVKYLEAIEQGSFEILPQTYIRAFIREYALIVGLQPDAVLRKFDVMVGGKYSVEQGAMIGSGYSGPATPAIPEAPASPPSPGGKPDFIRQNDKRTVGVVVATAFAAVALIYFMYDYATQDKKVPVPQETPFQDVVKEEEKELTPQPAALDTFAAIQAAPKIDSLTLRGFATDTVWIAVSRDSLKAQNSVILPKGARTWVAARKFTVTLGNAGGIRFTLNGTDLGKLGKRGAVLRNFVITSKTLEATRPHEIQ